MQTLPPHHPARNKNLLLPSYHHDRPSGHYFRERERLRARSGLVRLRDLIPDAIRELMRERTQ